MAKKRKFTPDQVITAIKKAEGYISQSAQILDCDISTVYEYINRYPKVKDARDSVKHRRDDFVESKMMTRIKEGSDTMIIFYAKTQMKHRGYIERVEHTGADGGAIEQVVTIDFSNLSDEQLNTLLEAANSLKSA
jgi:hypothetical protein